MKKSKHVSPHPLGDAPIVPEMVEAMNKFARMFDDYINGSKAARAGAERKWGFVILTFPFNNEKDRCNFISNGADRKEITVLFKEMIARFEGQPYLDTGTKQ